MYEKSKCSKPWPPQDTLVLEKYILIAFFAKCDHYQRYVKFLGLNQCLLLDTWGTVIWNFFVIFATGLN